MLSSLDIEERMGNLDREAFAELRPDDNANTLSFRVLEAALYVTYGLIRIAEAISKRS